MCTCQLEHDHRASHRTTLASVTPKVVLGVALPVTVGAV